MLKELYTRDPSDPLYYPGILEQSDEIETLLGQIRMIMFTKQGDVLGSYTFGYNLEDNLFLFNLTEGPLKSTLRDAIYTYCPDAAKYDVDVQVQFFRGSVRDVCLIDIVIDGQKRLGVLIK
jgi:hypothetical protein